MKYLNLLLFVLFIFISGCSQTGKKSSNAAMDDSSFSDSVKHVVLISLDGARPEYYMDTNWLAPHLQKFKNQGVYAGKGIKSVFPSITYPAHTSIITGAYPREHGIYYNKPIDGESGEFNWKANTIKVETLWDAIMKAGMTSGSVFWPVSAGAPINYNFPEKGYEFTKEYPYIAPKHLLKNIEKEIGEKFTTKYLDNKNFGSSKAITAISKYIIKTYKPNLMAIHFVAIDHAEHAHGVDGPKVRETVRVIDSLVGAIVKTIKDAGIWKNMALLITGDHGHTNTHETFAPNIYLAKHGLINQDNWKARFYPTSGSAFLELKNENDQATIDSVITILESTPEYKDGYFRILDRKTISEMGGPNVPLAIAMKAGVTISRRTKGKIIVNRKNASSHGYDPAYPSMNTMFIAVGAGIGKHKNITGMGVIDIAPVIAHLLNLDFNVPDGKLIDGILK